MISDNPMHKTELFNNVIARLIIHHVIARLCKSRGNLPASASTTSSVRHASLAKM